MSTEEGTESLPTVMETVKSLTGFDELAIEKMFKKPVDELDGIKLVRAIVFVQERRTGLDDKTAYNKMMNLTVGQVSDRFAKEDEDGEEEGNG